MSIDSSASQKKHYTFLPKTKLHRVTRNVLRHLVSHKARALVLFVPADCMERHACSFNQFVKDNPAAAATEALLHLFWSHHFRRGGMSMEIAEGGKTLTTLCVQTLRYHRSDRVGGFLWFLYDTESLVPSPQPPGQRRSANEPPVMTTDDFVAHVQRLVNEPRDFNGLGLDKTIPRNPVQSQKNSLEWPVLRNKLASRLLFADHVNKHFGHEFGGVVSNGFFRGTSYDPFVIFTLENALKLKRKYMGPDMKSGRSEETGLPMDQPRTLTEEIQMYCTFFNRPADVRDQQEDRDDIIDDPYSDDAIMRDAQRFAAQRENDMARGVPHPDDPLFEDEPIAPRVDAFAAEVPICMPPNRFKEDVYLMDSIYCHPKQMAGYYMPHQRPRGRGASGFMRFVRKFYHGEADMPPDAPDDAKVLSDAQLRKFAEIYGDTAASESAVSWEDMCDYWNARLKKKWSKKEAKEAISEFESVWVDSCRPFLSDNLYFHMTFLTDYLEKHRNVHSSLGLHGDMTKQKGRCDPVISLLRWTFDSLEMGTGHVAGHAHHVLLMLACYSSVRGDDAYLYPRVLLVGSYGLSKSWIIGAVVKGFVPGTVKTLVYGSPMAMTAKKDDRGGIMYHDEAPAGMMGTKNLGREEDLIEFVLGSNTNDADQRQEQEKMSTGMKNKEVVHLAFDKDTGDRIQVSTRWVGYWAFMGATNCEEGEINGGIRQRWYIKNVPSEIPDKNDAIVRGRPLQESLGLSPAESDSIYRYFTKYSQLQHALVSVTYLFLQMGVLRPVDRVCHGMFVDRYLYVLQHKFSIDARTPRNAIKLFSVAESLTIARAIYIVFSLGIGGPDLGRPFAYTDMLLLQPFLSISMPCSLFVCELTETGIDPMYVPVCAALNFIVEQTIENMDDAEKAKQAERSRKYSDANYAAVPFFPNSVYDRLKQIKYLANEVFGVIQMHGSRATRRAVICSVAALYRACVPVDQYNMNGTFGKSMMCGLKPDELPQYADNTTISVFGSVDASGNFAPQEDRSRNALGVGNKRGNDGTDRADGKFQKNNQSNATMKSYSRSSNKRMLIVNKKLLTQDARSSDIYARAFAECLHPDNARARFLRGRTDGKCSQFDELVFIPRNPKDKKSQAILTIPGVTGLSDNEEEERDAAANQLLSDAPPPPPPPPPPRVPTYDMDEDEDEVAEEAAPSIPVMVASPLPASQVPRDINVLAESMEAMPIDLPRAARAVIPGARKAQVVTPTPSQQSSVSTTSFDAVTALLSPPIVVADEPRKRYFTGEDEESTFPIKLSGKAPIIRNPSYVNAQANQSIFRSNPNHLPYQGLERLLRRPPLRTQTMRANEEDRCYMRYLKRINFFEERGIPDVRSERLKAPGLSFNLVKIQRTICLVQQTAYLAVKAMDIWTFQLNLTEADDALKLSNLYNEDTMRLNENVCLFVRAMIEHFLCLHRHYALENQTVSLGHVKVKLRDYAFKESWHGLAAIIRDVFLDRVEKREYKKKRLFEIATERALFDKGDNVFAADRNAKLAALKREEEKDVNPIEENFCDADVELVHKLVRDWFYRGVPESLSPSRTIDSYEKTSPIMDVQHADNKFMDAYRQTLVLSTIEDEEERREMARCMELDEEDYDDCEGDFTQSEFSRPKDTDDFIPDGSEFNPKYRRADVEITDVKEEEDGDEPEVAVSRRKKVVAARRLKKKKTNAAKKRGESLRNDRVFRDTARREQRTMGDFYESKRAAAANAVGSDDVGDNTNQLMQQLTLGSRHSNKKRKDDEESIGSLADFVASEDEAPFNLADAMEGAIQESADELDAVDSDSSPESEPPPTPVPIDEIGEETEEDRIGKTKRRQMRRYVDDCAAEGGDETEAEGDTDFSQLARKIRK